MKKKDNPNINESGDLIFRWKLEETDSAQRKSQDTLKNFIQKTLAESLNIISLTYKGEDVKVDGFRFLNEAKINKIFSKK
jgi:uncharacterized protein (DUF2461 family)